VKNENYDKINLIEKVTENGCEGCHKLIEYKCSKLKDLNKKLDEAAFDC